MEYEAVLALANGIRPDGHLTDDAQATVDLALDHYHSERTKYLIMSGEWSYKASFTPPISEAQAMKDYAVSRGVAAEKVLIETESQDTFGNALFTKMNLLEPLGIGSVLVIAGPNHSRERLAYIFGKVLGRAYLFDFVMHGLDRPYEAARERESLAKLRDMFDDVPDGDDAALQKRLRARHPAYKS